MTTAGKRIAVQKKLANSQEYVVFRGRAFSVPSQGNGIAIPLPKGLGRSTQTWADSSLLIWPAVPFPWAETPFPC